MLRRTLLQAGVALVAPAAPINIMATFLQLMPWHRQWPETRWRELFSCFDKLGIREVIVQWSASGETKLFPAPIESIVKLAQERGIAVDLGLRNDPAYWTRILGARDSVQAYFRKIRAESEAVARQLRSLPFRGWYICEEIDDLNWRDPAARQLLIEYLGGLSAALDRIEPKRPISISGFAQGRTDPEAFSDLWREILRHSRIETIMLQDGIGAGKLNLSEIPLFFEAAASAARHEGRTFRPVVELFRQVRVEPFRGVPAPYRRIVKQLEIAARFGPPVAFSVMDYMSPLGIEGANELYLESIGSR
jgi:hypothetical protein